MKKNISGVYILLSNKKIIYIGRSQNIYRRISCHKDKIFDDFCYIRCRHLKAQNLEALLIQKHKPILNINQKISKGGQLTIYLSLKLYKRLQKSADSSGQKISRYIVNHLENTHKEKKNGKQR